MLRMRGIKPGFFLNEQLADLPAHGRLLFIGLWMLADREGRLEDRPRRIHAAVFPYEPEVDVAGLLGALASAGFIERYSVDDQGYICLPRFTQHQNINAHESASSLPPNPLHLHADASTSRQDEAHLHASLNGIEGNGIEEREKRAPAREDGAAAPVSLSLVERPSDPEPEAEPDPPPDRTDDQVLYDAWCAATGRIAKTASERRSWVKALNELRHDTGLDPPGCASLIAQYRAKLGSDRQPTPGQVAGMYSQLGASPYVLNGADGRYSRPNAATSKHRPDPAAEAAAKRAALAKYDVPPPANLRPAVDG